jgi:hypothetical protein
MKPYCLIIISLIFIITSCGNKYLQHVKQYHFHSSNGKPDYSNLNYWAAHPYKYDLADSVPKPLRKNYKPDSTVDVFFIHPTTYTDKEKLLGWNAPIDNDTLNAKTDYTSMLFQASIFNEAGRVFAPRYRQANYYSYFPQTKEDTLNAIQAFELAYADVKTAFTYYLQHWNNGRPIIIASHSQGTTHAKRLLKDFFENSPLAHRLVVAYLVGIPVEPNYFTSLQPCINPYQTVCFCSWRTLQQGYKPNYMLNERYTAVVTNPLTWDSVMPNAHRFLNEGSVLLKFNKLIKHVASANVSGGVLFTTKPRFLGSMFYTTQNYHVADYNFYYVSIRKNVQQRVNAFWKK